MPKARRRKMISEKAMQNRLQLLIEKANRKGTVGTFEQHGIMTSNKGLVVTLPSGQQFQITIVHSGTEY